MVFSYFMTSFTENMEFVYQNTAIFNAMFFSKIEHIEVSTEESSIPN